MTQSTHATQSTYVAPAATRLHPGPPLTPPPPIEHELHVDPLPKLRIWASYPNGSHPESVEITYDGDAPATVEFIAGIVRSLTGSSHLTHVEMTSADTLPARGSLTRAINTANLRTMGTSQ